MTATDAPQLLADLLLHAERVGASDIHLQFSNGAAHVAFRLDGLVAPVTELTGVAAERLAGRIKFLARLKTYQDSLPQDGRIDRTDVGLRNDVRVATYPTVTGEKIVLRLFPTGPVLSLAELGLPAPAAAALRHFLAGPAGLLLLTGPAGSGKTTTIYACLRQLAESGARHIITVEDPVEQVIPGVMQTEVNEARGLTFAKAARHLLRQDPQVLVLGEIRDDETANLAVRAGLTGHLVISTLHAGSCREVYERLALMCADRFAAASVTGLILNQRLVRCRCRACAGNGCADCLDTGYRGRAPLVEWVRVDEPTRDRLRAQGVSALVPATTLAEAAAELVERGVTDGAEIQRVLG